MNPAIRRLSPHVIPREPPGSIVPRPPPPDWSLEPPPENTPAPVARRAANEWPTSLLTIETSAYKPRGTPARASVAPAARRPRRLGLTALALGVALVSLALALWQLYWLLESTDRGRALIDAASAAIAWVSDRF